MIGSEASREAMTKKSIVVVIENAGGGGMQLRRHPTPWREISTLEATCSLLDDLDVLRLPSREHALREGEVDPRKVRAAPPQPAQGARAAVRRARGVRRLLPFALVDGELLKLRLQQLVLPPHVVEHFAILFDLRVQTANLLLVGNF